MHGVLRHHPAHGARVELPELLPRLPSQLHQEVGSIPGLPGRRYDGGETGEGSVCQSNRVTHIIFPAVEMLHDI